MTKSEYANCLHILSNNFNKKIITYEVFRQSLHELLEQYRKEPYYVKPSSSF